MPEPDRVTESADSSSRPQATATIGLSIFVLHGFTDFRCGRPELTVPDTARTRHPLAICHRYVGAATTTVSGIKVTTVAQSLLDVVTRAPLRKLERALDDCLAGDIVEVA